MNDAPIPSEAGETLDALTEFARGRARDAATYKRSRLVEYPIAVLDIKPIDKRACPINIIAEQFLVVTVGSIGGQWSLSYSDGDVAFAKQIIAAVVAGNVTERFAFARSRVTVTLDDGTSERQTGYDGCLSLLVPQPGWTRWGRLATFGPYSS